MYCTSSPLNLVQYSILLRFAIKNSCGQQLNLKTELMTEHLLWYTDSGKVLQNIIHL